jgi:hypothetical protein
MPSAGHQSAQDGPHLSSQRRITGEEKAMTRSHSVRHRIWLACAALGLVAALGGCVAYPAYPGYGYGYGPYYGGYPAGYVAVGGGWGWHGHDWH